MPRSFRRIAARLFECDNKIRAYTRAVIILSTCRSLASLSRASFLSLFSSLPLLLIALCAMSPLKRNGSRESRRNRKERKKKGRKRKEETFIALSLSSYLRALRCQISLKFRRLNSLARYIYTVARRVASATLARRLSARSVFY